MTVKTRKKLIEVALPLDAINEAAAREKSIRHGHPSTLHLWWARRPLAAARAVIFTQMVDDPSTYAHTLLDDPEFRRMAEQEWERRQKEGAANPQGAEKSPQPILADCAADLERQRLFKIIEDLVQWENTNNEAVLARARAEIWKSWRRACADNAEHPRAKELFDPQRLPAFHDPFAGGGALPLEAQRLGLEAYASDLNPVAVTINKAMIEIPPRFAGRAPVGPLPGGERQPRLPRTDWRGAQGLAEDVRRYGAWMREVAQQRIGHLYPPIEITPALAANRPDLKPLIGQKLTVIAWLWARTVKSPNPAFSHVDVPLASTFVLSSKKGKEAYVVEPMVEGDRYRFTVKVLGNTDSDEAAYERAKNGTKLARGANFECLLSKTPIEDRYIKSESMAGRMGARLMAIVAEGPRGRVYLPPTEEHEAIARQAQPTWKPDQPMNRETRDLVSGRGYGFFTWADLFTSRQLVALTTFSDLVTEAIEKCWQDALAAGMPDDGMGLDQGGSGATAYAQAVGVYLASGVSRLSNRLATICIWNRVGEKIEQVFARQAIPMTWDFAEANTFSDSTGGWAGSLEWVPKAMEALPLCGGGEASQADAGTQSMSEGKMISTDPPYYDNIGYADLSDFFYVWLRRSLRPIFPGLFATLAVPKAEELVATPYRHGSKEAAEAFFLDGMRRALKNLAEQAHPAFPVTLYYAFKQSETRDEAGTSSTGWETFLQAVLDAGFAITGTWPMRTERDFGVKTGSNVLASSIVLVCRKRAPDAPVASRREFVTALRAELPAALRQLQAGNIAPVDLAQAAIGPGMAVYTRYAKVLDAGGNTVSVRDALALINAKLDEVLAEQESDFDADSRWALAWFEQNGFAEGEYGVAETLSKAKNTSIKGLEEAGILRSGRGKVRLLKPEDLPANWDPATDPRRSVWKMVHHLIRALEKDGESAAAELKTKLGAGAEAARELAYRLYRISDRKKRTAEALSYNALVQSWPEIARLAQQGSDQTTAEQPGLI